MAVFGVFFYLFAFGTGFSSGPYIIECEIFPLYARSAGAASGAVSMWLSNFLVSMTFLSEADAIGKPYTFFGYALVTVLFGVYLYFDLPETQGKVSIFTPKMFCIDESQLTSGHDT